jgi:serine/threonine-protein phosphatase 2A regulatory subunit B''
MIFFNINNLSLTYTYLSSFSFSTQALRYWFNVCDIDGDGILTMRDLRYFAEDHATRMREHGMEVVKFEDIICQLHDLLKPRVEGQILYTDFTAKDRIKLTGALFSALFDLDKFQRFEGRDPKLVKQVENYAQSQWDSFCASEYLRLASEEEEAQSMVQGGARGWM